MATLTGEEKNKLSLFINLAASYIRDGYSVASAEYLFEDDPSEEDSGESIDSLEGKAAENDQLNYDAGLPLAYMVEETEDYETSPDSDESFDSGESKDSLDKVAAEISLCKNCGLCATRTKVVPGEGSASPTALIIGEGPGADEDKAGRPFVGRAGQLLDRMLASIGLYRGQNCFIGNVVKCRPPGNRDPEAGEIEACFHFLERQIRLLKPKVILCVGRFASQTLLKTSKGINSLRGDFREYRPNGAELRFEHNSDTPPLTNAIPLLCTFHPSALLRDENLKRPAWEDLKLLKAKIDALDTTPSTDNHGEN